MTDSGSNRQVACVRVRLRGFTAPDTRSEQEGYVDPGTYEVIDDRLSGEVDYHRLRMSAMLGGDTWICSRWRNTVYADVADRPAFQTPGDEVLQDASVQIGAEDLVGVLPHFHDFRYDLDVTRYPAQLDLDLPLPVPPPQTNNCCSFAEALIVGAWRTAHPRFDWSWAEHRRFMIWSNDDMFSPVTAVVEKGIGALASDDDCPPRPWTLVQGWRRQWRDGHTFIVVAYHVDTDKVLTLESNHAYGLDGVGFRGVGNLRDMGGRPPPEWWLRDEVWTWSRICNIYRFRRAAYLAVLPAEWPTG